MQKKLMLLGGIRYLLSVIEAAHKMGVYVITADYLPDNIAHKYSDEYVNVSIIDLDAVLKVAQEKKIDGILSFGVDPGVVTVAHEVFDDSGMLVLERNAKKRESLVGFFEQPLTVDDDMPF